MTAPLYKILKILKLSELRKFCRRFYKVLNLPQFGDPKSETTDKNMGKNPGHFGKVIAKFILVEESNSKNL